ncbi:MAG TPA: hypothetical protein VFZ97_14535 [Acidimicrobiales bacterium]
MRAVQPATGLNKELASLRDTLDRMVKRRLLYPFSPEEAKLFNELTAREVRLIEILETGGARRVI